MAKDRDSRAKVERAKAHRLACLECGEVTRGDTRGWRAYLTVDIELAVYCPECARKDRSGYSGDG